MSRRRAAANRTSAGEALQRLVNLVSHRTGATIAIMSEAAVTLPQVLALSRVEAAGSASPSDLAPGASPPAASQMIDRLVQQGLLHRAEDPVDRRRKTITLTAAARGFLEKLEAARAADYELGLAPLGAEARSALTAALQQAAAEVERARDDRRRQGLGAANEERA
jgi:DNA-binding MarR family transcriptional regulator